jgi:signal transduction histidine kinase
MNRTFSRMKPITSEQYQKLIAISFDLASTLELDSLLKRIVSTSVELTDSEASSILLYDPEKQALFFEASTDSTNELLMNGLEVPMTSVAGWTVKNLEPTTIDNVHTDPRYYNHVEQSLQFPTHSMIAVPMITRGKLVGVLEVLNKRNGQFSPTDQAILEVLGTQAAVAIENARIFHQADLISDLVHELRTPLTSIATITYILQKQDITEQNRISMAQTIQSEVKRLNELTTNYLDLARLESGRSVLNIDEFDLSALVEECVEIISPQATESEITITLHMPHDLPKLKADRNRIKQVLLNLLTNAIKYNSPHGKIIISAQTHDQMMDVSVADTGLGIPDEEISHIFEKFYRASNFEKKSLGTGLGLSISKRIIESHGGSLTLKSRLNEGSTFTFSIPLTPIDQKR